MKFITEILNDTYKSVIAAIAFSVVCIVGEYRSFSYVKWGDFELSFDVLYFFSLTSATVLWVYLAGKALKYLGSVIYGKNILKELKKCTLPEKNFLYNRIFENDNELTLDLQTDSYFYEKEYDVFGNLKYRLYKQEFPTKEKVLIFLRKLENKGILKNGGNQTMIIPQQIWDILVQNSDEIFIELKLLGGLKCDTSRFPSYKSER